MEEEEGDGKIYVCVAGDAGVGGTGGMQRETAGPIIDGALLG